VHAGQENSPPVPMRRRRGGTASEGANIDEVEKMLKAIRLVIRSAIFKRGQKFITDKKEGRRRRSEK